MREGQKCGRLASAVRVQAGAADVGGLRRREEQAGPGKC
jgi:hypothetical protein